MVSLAASSGASLEHLGYPFRKVDLPVVTDGDKAMKKAISRGQTSGVAVLWEKLSHIKSTSVQVAT